MGKQTTGQQSGHPHSLDAVNDLQRHISGLVITVGDTGYDEARRVWNGMIDRHPVAVVRAADAGDIGPVVQFARAHGLTIDNLVAAEVLTAAGENVTASDSENSELLWGLRGGGGNFGVVSTFTFQAHPLPAEVFSGNLVYGRDRWLEALRAFEAWTRDLPAELTSIISFLVPPPGWEPGDDPLMLLGFAWASPDIAAGEEIVDRLRRAAPPDAEVVEPARWTAWQSAVDELFPRGVRGYWKNTSFDRLDDDVIQVIARRAAEQTWRGTGFDIHHMGGAVARVDEEAPRSRTGRHSSG
ncbi:hypothetical protein [Cryobacterium sp. TmT2-59]|uniref:hypothetical protein n=1 Tax=Cryobacterium sp. TmT2-59 TaxID=1259264 RepID=UPI00321F8709